jgi:hypothetical protein
VDASVIFHCLGIGIWFASAVAAAELSPPSAYQWAADIAGVPSFVLWAVALEESGTPLQGRLVPWPWTLNIAGAPNHYANRAAACDALRWTLLSIQPTRIDVGLLQVNMGYHGRRYSLQPCALLDPYTNLVVGADILRGHHVPGEDWMVAVGRYHRPAGGQPAIEYQRRVAKFLPHMPANGGGTRTPEEESLQ